MQGSPVIWYDSDDYKLCAMQNSGVTCRERVCIDLDTSSVEHLAKKPTAKVEQSGAITKTMHDKCSGEQL
jgi:hypothetical protein